MKVLFMILHYSSLSGSAAARIVDHLIEEFQEQGIQADILTTKETLDQPFETIRDFGSIYRIKSYCSLNYKKLNCNRSQKAMVAFHKIKEKFYFQRKSRFCSRALVHDFYNGLKKVGVEQYDFIIPVCAEYALYAAIEKYRKKEGLEKKVIVYQLDPLSLNSAFHAKSYEARLRMEHRMSKEKAIVTTQILKGQKESKGIDCSNVAPLEFPSIVKKLDVVKSDSKGISVVFSGFFYGDMRNPEYALNLFSKIKNPSLKLYIIGSGAENLINRYVQESNGRIISLGVLPLNQAEEKVLEADFLLNIGNKDISFVPSKIFDYISTGKPIINTYTDRNCPTLKYFSKYENVISVYEKDDIEKSVKDVSSFIVNNKDKVIPFEEIKEKFYENTVEYVANRFIEILNEKQ